MKTCRQFPIIGSLWLAFSLTQLFTQAQAPVTPGPEHAILAALEGTWSAKVKMEGVESDGTMTWKMECGGLWLIGDFRGEMGGQKFQGRGMDGYDPEKKKYVSVWVDSMSARPVMFEGTYDKEKKTLTMTGEGLGPDGRPAKYKMTTQTVDRDHLKFTMFYLSPDGQEIPAMTIEYARKK